MKKTIRFIAVLFALIMLLTPAISATVPYSTYTYSIDGEVLNSPDAYVPQGIINSETLKLEQNLKNPADIESDGDGNLYITDKKNNRIVVVDKYYDTKLIIGKFINQHGVDDSFNEPASAFVHEYLDDNGENQKELFVCDTFNSRLVVFDAETGAFIREIKRPESDLFGEDAQYSPVSCVVDKYGRIYVASNATTEGIIVMTNQGEFINFIGAPKVVLTALDMLIQMISPTMAEQQVFVPTTYSTLDLDKTTREFVYATILYTSNDEKNKQEAQLTTKESDGSPVRLLNAKGSDIMNRNGFFAPSGEVAIKTTEPLTGANANAPQGPSRVQDIASGPNGIWSIIDQDRSKIYSYDRDGNLLYIFGDRGTQLGNLTSPAAITYQTASYPDKNGNMVEQTNIVVLDVTTASFTVYRATDYANLLSEAISYQNKRLYDEAVVEWEKVLTKNNNFDTAYVEMGKALYRNGKYEEAKEFFMNAFDTENYALTYKEIRKSNMEVLFLPLIAGIVLVLIGLGWVFKKAAKINKAAAVKAGPRSFKEELTYGFHLMFHPFDGYWDLKHEKRGSVRASIVFLLITVVAFVYQSQGKGYYFNPQGVKSSAFSSILTVVIPFALWIIANWCFTTLFDGEGSIKDIFIATSYALYPVPVLVIISTALTNVFVGTEAQITSMIVTIALIWMALLIIIGMQVTHDYSMGKNVLTVIATIVGMVFIMFLALLFVSLISKMAALVTTISSELSYR